MATHKAPVGGQEQGGQRTGIGRVATRIPLPHTDRLDMIENGKNAKKLLEMNIYSLKIYLGGLESSLAEDKKKRLKEESKKTKEDRELVEGRLKALGFTGMLVEDGKIAIDAREFIEFVARWQTESLAKVKISRGNLPAQEWPMKLLEFIGWKHSKHAEKASNYSEQMQAWSDTLEDVKKVIAEALEGMKENRQGSLF